MNIVFFLMNIVYLLIFKVKEEVGSVSILVNNAGVVYTSDLFATQDAQIEKTFEVNVLAHFWVSAISFTKYFLLKTQRLKFIFNDMTAFLSTVAPSKISNEVGPCKFLVLCMF